MILIYDVDIDINLYFFYRHERSCREFYFIFIQIFCSICFVNQVVALIHWIFMFVWLLISTFRCTFSKKSWFSFFRQMFRAFRCNKIFCDRKKSNFKTWISNNLMFFNIEFAKRKIHIFSTLFDTRFVIFFSCFALNSLKITTLQNNVCFINSYNAFSIFNDSIFIFQNEFVSNITHDRRKFWFFDRFDEIKIVFLEHFEYNELKKIVLII